MDVLEDNLFTINEKSHIKSLTRGKLGLSTVVDALKEIGPEDEMKARDKLKKNSAPQGKQILANTPNNERQIVKNNIFAMKTI